MIPQHVVLKDRKAIVIGIPDEDHNCDAMGCSTIEHVIARVTYEFAPVPWAALSSPSPQPAGEAGVPIVWMENTVRVRIPYPFWLTFRATGEIIEGMNVFEIYAESGPITAPLVADAAPATQEDEPRGEKS